MKSLSKEGWIKKEGKHWVTQYAENYCAYCFRPIEDIYLIDIDNYQYCSENCMDAAEAVEPYDSYWDYYFCLFLDFKELKPKCDHYLKNDIMADADNYLNILQLIQDINEVFDNPDYNDIWYNGGDDGTVAAEMYRMLKTLQKDSETLRKKEEWIRKNRKPQGHYYSIIVDNDSLSNKEVKRKLEHFIKLYNKYRDENRCNVWTTENIHLRNKWWDRLNKNRVPVSYINSLECPCCGKVDDERNFHRALDNYKYCYECIGELYVTLL